MKKFFAAVMILLSLSSFTEAKTLAVYFSRTGTTKSLFDTIAQRVSFDEVFRIEPAVPYPDDYTATTQQAQQEQNDNARPALLNDIADISEYDTIFLGYPIWWGTVPMIIHTFLEAHDFGGKRIIPFNTHGGSGKGRSINDIRTALPDSNVEEGFAVRSGQVDSSREAIISWAEGLNVPAGETGQQEQEQQQVEDMTNEETESTQEGQAQTVTANSNTTSSGGGCEAGVASVIILPLLYITRRKYYA